MTLLGITSIIIALSSGYYLFKRARWEENRKERQDTGDHASNGNKIQ
jgi:hypothetical protein